MNTAAPSQPYTISVRLTDLRQLFDSLDPSPFIERDLDNDAEEFIVSWAKDCPSHQPIEIVIHLADAPTRQDVEADTERAIHNFFIYKAGLVQREFRQKLRQGRTTLLIGLLVLAASVGAGELLTHYYDGPWAKILRESMLIGGWVAMWGPMEIFLYGWWPIARNKRVFEKLAAAPVRLVVAEKK